MGATGVRNREEYDRADDERMTLLFQRDDGQKWPRYNQLTKWCDDFVRHERNSK
jgi:hypothetical protein